MFFELRLQKIYPVIMAFLVIVIGTLMFVIADGKWSMVAHTADLVQRQAAIAYYTLTYKLPGKSAAGIEYSGGPSVDTQAIPVLLYHGTPPEGNSNPPLPLNVFVDQMHALKADGWHTITIEQFEDFMKNGTPVPPKSFLLTFDDGRKESFYPVDPVLKDLNYTAVMFVITGFSLPDPSGKASTFYLNRTELQYMVDSGRWELESHGAQDHKLYDVPSATSTNGVLATLPQEHFLTNKFWLQALTRVETDDEYTTRITNDLAQSRQTLENDFGKPVVAFAFPFNDYGQNTANFPEAQDALAGIVPSVYTFAFYQINPSKTDPFNYPDPDTYMIKRIEPTGAQSGKDLVTLLDQSAPKILPYESADFNGSWSGNWGVVESVGDALTLKASDTTTGAAALLNGSSRWHNYSMTATVNWQSGADISLIGRYVSDSKPFLTCAFSKDRIMIESHVNGEQKTLDSVPYTFTGDRANAMFAMSLKGTSVSCSAGGVSATAALDPSFDHAGSAGVQVWDPTEGAAQIELKQISVGDL